jgi:hypothetical protein
MGVTGELSATGYWVIGYSKLAVAGEDRILAGLTGAAQRPFRSDHRSASWSGHELSGPEGLCPPHPKNKKVVVSGGGY